MVLQRRTAYFLIQSCSRSSLAAKQTEFADARLLASLPNPDLDRDPDAQAFTCLHEASGLNFDPNADPGPDPDLAPEPNPDHDRDRDPDPRACTKHPT